MSTLKTQMPPTTHSPARKEIKGTPCSLCGLPVGLSNLEQKAHGGKLHFCCPGCMNVYQILSLSNEREGTNFRDTELFRACVVSGLIPGSEEDLLRIQEQSHGEEEDGLPKYSNEKDLLKRLELRVEGMWCTACSWLIEHVLIQMEGIVEAKVNFASDLLEIQYLPHRVDPADISKKLSKLGYKVRPLQDDVEDSSGRKELLVRLGVSAILTMNVMMISFCLYFGLLEDIGEEGIVYFSYPLLIMATPVVFYGGYPILVRAWTGLRYRNTSMDTLIAVGSLSAYLYSIVQMGAGSIHLYFDTAAMLITIVLLGRYIEMHARSDVSRSIYELHKVAGGKARLIQSGRERWVSSGAVQKGDEFEVRQGERVPLDGVVIAGEATVDESILTGESKPWNRSKGEEVLAGTLLLEGALTLCATRLGKESSLGQMITLMQAALAKKDRIELLADRIMRWIVPSILILAASSALYLLYYGVSTNEALLRAVTILVITCPCALGIATPLAKVACIGVGRTNGILIRDSAALEKIKGIDVMVFDKTGTLTEGSYSLRSIVTTGYPEKAALAMVASLEMHSEHFLAREIVRRAGEESLHIEEALQVETLEGQGVKGTVGNCEVLVGSRRMMVERGLSVPMELDREAAPHEEQGATIVFFAWEERVQGILIFGDIVKAGSQRLISELERMGVSTWLVSGDSERTTRAIAHALGVRNARGRKLPQDKVQIIAKLREQGHRVGMIGDGINDAAALAQADVGIALGTGVNILQEASDITIVGTDPEKLLSVLRLSQITGKVIRQNVFFAFLYNVLGVPLAVMGMLNPFVAALAMFASSLTVITNTFRISKYRGHMSRLTAPSVLHGIHGTETTSSGTAHSF